jgi:large subunit ribosomal protein L25
MIKLKAKKRDKLGRKNKQLRKQGILPAVLYGGGVESTPLEINLKEFEKVFREAGTSSLISLDVKGKEYQVLIHEISKDPLTGAFLHVDFYSPSKKKETTVEIPLIFEGIEEVQKESGGNVLKEIQEVEVKGLAYNLPREIKVDVSSLKNFEDRILVKDIKIPEGNTILREKEDIVAILTPPAEEEIEKPQPEEEKTVEEKPTEEKKLAEEKREERKEQEGKKS